MDTRQKIVEEAAIMFRTYGIRAVTMDMLAGQMGISKRTIYENFSDKEEILSAVLKWMSFKQKELIVKIFNESENVIEAIFRLEELMSEHHNNMSPAFVLDMEKYHNDIIRKLKDSDELPFNTNNEEMLRRGIREGVFRKDIDINISNQCIHEMFSMSNEGRNSLLEGKSKHEVIRDFYLNYLRGISTPKGLSLIEYYQKINRTPKSS